MAPVTPVLLQIPARPQRCWAVRLEGLKTSHHSPYPSADLTSAAHPFLYLFSSISGTSVYFPGQDLLCWPQFSWMQPPPPPRAAGEAAPCQAWRWHSLGGRVAQHPAEATKRQADPRYHHAATLRAQPNPYSTAVVWRCRPMTTTEHGENPAKYHTLQKLSAFSCLD